MVADMPSAADTIRVLIATDNHVGYQERDPIRGEDSWRSFDEVLSIAKERDVDMVLLAGDLFHENKPSRKSLYHVMSCLRKHSLGMKPCELELLSDGSEVFEGSVYIFILREEGMLLIERIGSLITSTTKIQISTWRYQSSPYMAIMTTHQG